MSRSATRLTLITAAGPMPLEALRFPANSDADAKNLDRLRRRAGRIAADRAVSSPDRSALHTAEALGVVPSISEALQDRAYGDWAGRSIYEVAREAPDLFARWLTEPDASAPGGESVKTLVGRASAWLDGLDETGASIVAVTHPPVVRACLVAALVCPAETWFRFDIGHATRTVLSRNGAYWRVGVVDAPL